MSIYLDNAATTRLSPTALDAMLPYFGERFGNPSSLHSVGQAAAEALADARARIAARLDADPAEVFFTSGGSESDTQALLTAAAVGARNGKRHIVSTAFEHHAVLHTLDRLKAEGFTVTLLPVHEDGLVRVEEVEAALTDDTALLSVMFANNEIGTVQPIAELGALCHRRGVLFHTDAVQAVGHLPVSVHAMHIDLLSASAHKFHGPLGTGILIARRGLLPVRLIEGGAQERSRRPGTENLPAIVGTAAALDEACAALPATSERLRGLRDRLITGLSAIPRAFLNGDATRRLPGLVSFCFEGIEGESLLLLLDDAGIQASSGSACTSGSLDPSHVLLAIGRPHSLAHGSLRLSLAADITDADIDATIRAVSDAVAYLRSFSPLWNARSDA